MSDKRYVALRGKVEVAEIRTAKFEGRDHVVVPVVALVGDAVVRPLGSKGWELVPSSVLASAPSGWDGRPVVPDHPGNGTESANTPSNLEKYAFGRVFNARFHDGSLKMEAWLDGARAEAVGDEALSVIARCAAGEVVEVSVGAYVSIEETSGTMNGQSFDYTWSALSADHLAMLPEGAEGACSVEMGCGAPRYARSAEVNVKGLDRFIDFFRSMFRANEVSDDQVRMALYGELRSSEPAFDWICDVFSDSSQVVYQVSPEGVPVTYRRSFTLGDDGTVALAKERDEVKMVIQYVAAENDGEGTSALRAACSCQGEEKEAVCVCHAAEHQHQSVGDQRQSAEVVDDGGETTMKKELVGRLIANERSPFSEEDRTTLESLSDEKLESLASAFKEETAAADADDAAATTDADDAAATTEETEEEAVAKLPASLRRQLARAQESEKREREGLIKSLLSNQDAYGRKDLEAKDTEELELLARALKIDVDDRSGGWDYSGRGAAVVEDDDNDRVTVGPNGISKALAALGRN